jgi:hypothetical protein
MSTDHAAVCQSSLNVAHSCYITAQLSTNSNISTPRTRVKAAAAAADAQDYQACTVLMNHCGNLLHHLSPAKSTELLNQARLAFLLAGSAALEVHKKMPEHAGKSG